VEASNADNGGRLELTEGAQPPLYQPDLNLREAQVLWAIFERVRSVLKAGGLVTYSDIFNRMASQLAQSRT
jgi:hypothetical protein